jgi:methanogenic corrinoid protein MtbC1
MTPFLSKLAREYLDLLLRGERNAAVKLILDVVEGGVSVREIYLQVFQPAQHEIGRLWETDSISVAQEHYCTAATQLVMSQLYSYVFSSEKIGRILVAACVGGELHEIGIRMVADFFEREGWDTHYLGANTPVQGIVQMIETAKADILALSSTIPFNITALRELIAEVKASDYGESIPVMVGGRPFNLIPELWKKVGADGYAPDALAALGTAERLLAANTTALEKDDARRKH